MKIITHSGGFHADDVFAVATLHTLYPDASVTRTRDPEVIKTGNFCVDVGGVYDPEKNLFDHHQTGGAGKRENGIPYSSFGLVWRSYGERLCGSREIADVLDREIVEPIDADDCGVDITKNLFDGLNPFAIGRIINRFRPFAHEKETSMDEAFTRAVFFAEEIIKREVAHTRDEISAREKVKEIYKSTEDKRILILEEKMPWEGVVTDELKEVLFVVYEQNSKEWRIKAVRKDWSTFESRKLLPGKWRGKMGSELAKISGVSDATFCHPNGFTGGAGSKDGVIKMAHFALGDY